MTLFEIDQQLQKDTHALHVYQEFHILLHRNATIPWFIVVPETTVVEPHELDTDQLNTLHWIQKVLGSYLQQSCGAEKINSAAIGNIVRQLHVHVIGRSHTDPCWPGVVWGADYPHTSYTPDRLDHIQQDLQTQLV